MSVLNISTKAILSLITILFFVTPNLFAQEQDLDELLNQDLSKLMKIEVVSASKRRQIIGKVPATVRVITAEQIQANGYITLEEALSDLPGFQFRNIIGLNSYVFQRGAPNQNNLILVLIDGIQINELNSGGFYGGGQYNLSNVERIEVVYGPASALYGTNAVSGIINIITKNAKENQGLNVGALYGPFHTVSADAGYGYYDEKNDFGFRLSAMYKSSEKADLRGAKGDNNWSEDMENFENDYSWDVKLNYKTFTAGINYQNKQSSASTYYKSVGTPYRDRGTLWNIRFINTFLKHQYNFSQKWLLSSQLYFRDVTVMDNSIQIINDTTQVGYYRPNNLFGLETLLNYEPHEQINISGGLVFENERLAEDYSKTYSASANEKPPPPPPPPMDSYTLFSAFIQAQYFFFQSFNITAGARFDKSSFYGQVVTPRLGLVYTKKRLTAKLLYMEAFRAPKPWDYYSGLGNPHLKPEKMKSVELYTSYGLNTHFRFNLSIYKNLFHERLSKEYFPNGWRWTNQGRLNTNGLEAELEYRFAKIAAYLNYTYNESYYTQENQIPEIAKHSANMGFTYSFHKNLKWIIRANYLGKRKNPRTISATGSNYIDDALLFHTTLSLLDVHNFNFYLIVKNLFDTEYYHTSNFSTVDRYRQPQRTILLKTEYKF